MSQSIPPQPQRHRVLLVLGLTLAAASCVMAWFWRQNQPPMPAEYQTLEAVVKRLAAHNDLGPNPLSFSINNGSYGAVLAQMRGHCKDEACDFFAQLNPYKSYNKDWDEISRQSYTLGDVGGWSTSSGTVEIPRSAFRIYGTRSGWLACTVAHEIAHIQRQHVFQASYYANNVIRDLPETRQEQLNYAKSRQQELEADRDAALMMARAGYRGRICLDDLVFIHRSSGDGSATETDSTHPGYDERTRALAAYYTQLEAASDAPKRARQTLGHFAFNKADNVLTFVPTRSIPEKSGT